MNTTGRFLLTGAGFSCDFGAPLAQGLWELVFNHSDVQASAELRKRLLSEFRIEDVYHDVMIECDRDQREIIHRAVVAAYATIDEQLREWRFDRKDRSLVNIHEFRNFIRRFAGEQRNAPGFIFTLNQDLLLERHYLGDPKPCLPGVTPPHWFYRVPEYAPANDEYIGIPTELPDGLQEIINRRGTLFYLKLHGSCNWRRGDEQSRIVFGRAKEEQIQSEPLLQAYFDVFRRVLATPNAQLLIIGYGFGDEHVNGEIARAIEEAGLRVHIVSPAPQKDIRATLQKDPAGSAIWQRLAGYHQCTVLQLFPGHCTMSLHWRTLKGEFFGET